MAIPPKRLLVDAGLTRQTLLLFTLLSAALNGMVTASVGSWLGHRFTSAQTHRTAIDELSSLLYGRRTRAGLVVSSLRRNADLDELKQRKQAYDEAYVDWNKNVRQNVFAVRDVMGETSYSTLEQDFENYIVEPLSQMDACMTKAYDERIGARDPLTVLDKCRMVDLYQFTLDCGATFTNELRKLTTMRAVPFLDASEREKTAARARISKACTKPQN